MKVPKVSLDIWQDLYRASIEFRSLEPWDLLDDSEIFGAKDPATGEVGYCCVLGAAGQLFGLCMYRGGAGLSYHQRLQKGAIDPVMDDAFALQDALLVEFCKRAELKKEDLAVVKALGFKPQKTGHSPPFPCFRDHAPGFAPWYISDGQAKWLTFALRCGADFIKAIEEDGLLEPATPGHILTYLPRDSGSDGPPWIREWQAPEPYAEPALPEVVLDELSLRKIQGARLRQDTAWEADAFFTPGTVVDGEDRPYYPRVALVAHKQSGAIVNMDISPPEKPPHFALRDVFLGTIETHGALPSELHVRDERILKALKPLTDKLGVRLKLKRTLTTLSEVKAALSREALGRF